MFRKTVFVFILMTISLFGICLIFTANYNVVIPDSIYRYPQLSGARFEKVVNKLGIRAVINLRGQHLEEAWYQEERRITESYEVELYDLPLNSKKLPSRAELQQLIDIIQNAPRPLLIHCREGHERTGMAGAVAILLDENKSLADARDQVSLNYFNLSTRSIGILLLAQYESWLAREETEHRTERFLQWVKTEYTDSSGNLRFRIDEINGIIIQRGSRYKDNYKFVINRHAGLEFNAHGWAIDPLNISVIKKVELFLNDKLLGVADYGHQRNDVAKALKNDAYKYSGWRISHIMADWPSECYDLKLRLTRLDSSFWTSGASARICVN